ncbi:sugar transferase [Priestia megaterium]|uniref:sugar transferase n=1 Tax=Priestia megaterium TaxID=1404 RepID=UPI002B250237|nr:sugar transferase [Priestia megaterium]MEB2265691.1 sugar transferase [Priestia megaterium]
MYQNYLKRLLDLLIGLIALPFFLIIYVVFGFLIKLEDKGPILYKAERIGKNCKSFKMYKFRSMKVNAPILLNKDGSTYNNQNDPRVTRVGKFMRETSIDEIPQIINVIKGEMSIVGPRASLISALDTFEEDEIGKMDVRPGITGYTQAYYRNGLSNREKRLKDSWYANNENILLDIKILFKTFITVFKKEGLYTDSKLIKQEENKVKQL